MSTLTELGLPSGHKVPVTVSDLIFDNKQYIAAAALEIPANHLPMIEREAHDFGNLKRISELDLIFHITENSRTRTLPLHGALGFDDSENYMFLVHED